jgi:hypothetical protein
MTATAATGPSRTREASIRALIWAFVGALYGFLFVSLSVFAESHALPINPNFFAGILAGTISALIYGSMRLTVLMATLLFPLSIVYFTQAGDEIPLDSWLTVMVPAGVVIGAIYGHFTTSSRIRRADAKTLAGFSVGTLVSLGYLIADSFFRDLPIAVVVGVMCPLTGALYVLVVPTFIKLYQDLLPPAGDGALIGGCIAIFVSFASFVMAGSIDTSLAGTLLPEVEEILYRTQPAVTGGIIGAGLGGAISGLLMTRWQDL